MATLPNASAPRAPAGKLAPITVDVSAVALKRAQLQKQHHHRAGPNPELTPDPSPRSASPVDLDIDPARRPVHDVAVQTTTDDEEASTTAKRRFPPQLIETSRRARRAGDEKGPRIADKTDTTPHARNKYRAKARGLRNGAAAAAAARQHNELGQQLHYLSDSEVDGPAHRPGVAARRAEERRLRDAVLEAFPNAHARAGGAAHFYFKDSGSDTSPDLSRKPSRAAFRQSAAHRAGSDSSTASGPAGLLPSRRGSSVDLGWWHKVHREHCGKVTAAATGPADCPDVEGGGGCSIAMPRPVRPARQQQHCAVAAAAAAHVMVDCDNDDDDPEMAIMRRAASPPMLGDDIEFVRCESPETVKIHTDLPWTAAEDEQKCRDQSEKGGLWKGFCFKAAGDDAGSTAADMTAKCGLWGAPKMISTPQPPATPHRDSFPMGGGGAHLHQAASAMLSPPLTPAGSGSRPGSASGGLSPFQQQPPQQPQHILAPKPQRPSAVPSAMMHSASTSSMSSSPPETLADRAKKTAALEARVRAEFDDAFVTQVYNYLALGYPVEARDFDDELCRITGMSPEEVRRDDERNLRAKGHVCACDVAATPAERQCPRWTALKRYIHEWARQHPDLDGLDPSPKAWGLKVRGGWAS